MANPPNPGLTKDLPMSLPVARWKGPNPYPPNVVPTPGPWTRLKAGLPAMPAVFKLFEKPRTPGHGR